MPSLRRRRTGADAQPSWVPEPPIEMPPGHLVHVPGHGELFVRDSGGDGPPVLLLHGWMFSADLNWWPAYVALQEAGHRVLALDHRGHGRGLRMQMPFRLTDCAEDAAALLETLDVGPVTAVGYSMGGPIAQLLAGDHPDRVSGVVLCATSAYWTSLRQKVVWRTLAFLRLGLALAPDRLWRSGLRSAGFPDSAQTTWTVAELTRGSAADLAEAGRELSRFDSRPWLADRVTQPAAVVVTTKDDGVPPAHQRKLAALLGAPTFEVAGDHYAVIARRDEFNAALLRALAAIGAAAAAGRAAA